MFVLSALLFVSGPQAPDAAAFLRDRYQLTDYQSATVDLNGDGVDEILVRASSRDYCGSGGCTLFVLSPEGGDFRVVMRATVTNPPVRVLDSVAHGWKDIGVTVSGGGAGRPYEARLRFDGVRYPGNPTVAPAEPVTGPSPAGRILIAGENR